jgi:hypothetical protein
MGGELAIELAEECDAVDDAVEYEDCNALLCDDGRGRAEPDLLDRGLIVGMRGKTEQREDAGERIVRRCKNSEWQRAVD